jgi:hypothetical protein
MGYSTQQIISIITQVANSKGVDPNLAIADAEVESGLNPYAVGDDGTSFGLYQLHEGGELGNLTPQQAFNPYTNAGVALSQFAVVESENPNLSPGWIAADAQRPANPQAYAQAVDAAYLQVSGGKLPPNVTFSSGSSGEGLSGILNFFDPKPRKLGLNPITDVEIEVEKYFYIGLGLAVILLGLFITFRDSSVVKYGEQTADLIG